MTIKQFLDDHYLSLVLNGFGGVALAIFLRFIGVAGDYLFLIFGIWLLVLLFYYGWQFFRQRQRIRKLKETMAALDQKNLLAEIAGKPRSALEQCYFDLLREANRSMTQQVSDYRRSFEEYQEYIEQWVHDVKTPIAASQLMLENLSLADQQKQELLEEWRLVDYYVEQALFYARSGEANKDYLLQEVSLATVVHEAIQKSQRQLIGHGFRIQVEVDEEVVWMDRKWVLFILTQIINNSIQYRSDNPDLCFYARKTASGTCLVIRDNGLGISQEELPRIFDKGFTGKKGRIHEKSSGIGLYLCKRLCDKLGLGLSIDSVLGEYTEVMIEFPQLQRG
ncbi:sensor histidine kinase [Enterococcus sp. 669A]|uniref:histidine kinase n=1 Tax=Candidatus Enterococcus moelleringii TaxID=2815325 RepID=A0ABS3L7S9_9ENTE|nr:sensor histidine kinase [Enterococcus sp. 669A]MBO1305678.1 sensor histidine kinase [Enterococcus sp. 669A]